MGFIKAFTGSLSSTFADQWKDLQSDPIISDVRCTEEYIMHCMMCISQQKCRGIFEYEKLTVPNYIKRS